MHTPQWELDALIGELNFVSAMDQERAVQAASAPHYKREDQKALHRSLATLTRPRGPASDNGFTPESFNDLDALAAYFTGLGIEVHRVKTS